MTTSLPSIARACTLIICCARVEGATIPASEDTSSNRTKLTLSANKAATLPVSASRRAFVFFDLTQLPAGSQIRYARLRVYFPSVLRAGNGLTIHKVSGGWQESSASDEPAFDSASIAAIDSAAIGTKRFLSVDVSDTVQSWLTTPATNEGFAIAAAVGSTPKDIAVLAVGAKEGSGSGYPAELDIEIADDPIAVGSIQSALLAPNLILAGTTTGSFSGPLTGSLTGNVVGNVTGNSGGFTGLLAGDVTGTQGGTAVTSVGGVSAVNVASGVNLASAFLINSAGNNTFVGDDAGNLTLSGHSNTATGVNALNAITTGNHNVAVGSAALLNNKGGLNNVAVGHDALLNNTTGNSNTAIGLTAGNALTTGSDNIAIGNPGVAGESNTTRLGSVQTRTFISGIYGVATGGANVSGVVINSSGQLGTMPSSQRYKESIADMGDASSCLLSLRPVTFQYKLPFDNGEKPVQFGLIAEEVAAAFPALAVFNLEGQPDGVKYHELPVLLLNEWKKLEAQNRVLIAESAALRDRLDKIEIEMRKLTQGLSNE